MTHTHSSTKQAPKPKRNLAADRPLCSGSLSLGWHGSKPYVCCCCTESVPWSVAPEYAPLLVRSTTIAIWPPAVTIVLITSASRISTASTAETATTSPPCQCQCENPLGKHVQWFDIHILLGTPPIHQKQINTVINTILLQGAATITHVQSGRCQTIRVFTVYMCRTTDWQQTISPLTYIVQSESWTACGSNNQTIVEQP